MKTVRPLGSRVLVQRSKVKSTKGGILLPETAREKPQEGEVIAVGPGAINDKGEKETLSVKVGDKVFFSSYSGTEVKGIQGKEDEELLIVNENDILGIVS